MASPNINLRDPVLYRIVHASHPRTGDAWCIYPTYDFAHGQSDAIEGVTHSICTLEFEIHRPLYDWLIEHLPVPSRPRQYEFARLNLTHTVLSKRVLRRLVEDGHVRGWDDPRMPTISGLRRRGFPAEGIRDFAAMIGVAKTDSTIEVGHSSTPYATSSTGRRRAGSRSSIRSRWSSTTIPRGGSRTMAVVNNPEDPSAGTRAGPVLARAVDRARRLHGGAGPQVLPARAGSRGAPADPRTSSPARGRQGRRRAGRRAALHVRPGDPRRRRARRSAAQGDPPLGLGRARHAGRGPPLRPPVRRPGARRAAATCFADLNPASETIVRGLPGRARPWPTRRSARRSSSSGSATSRPIPTPGPRRLVFNRTLTLKDTWAKVQAQRGEALTAWAGVRPTLTRSDGRRGSTGGLVRHADFLVARLVRVDEPELAPIVLSTTVRRSGDDRVVARTELDPRPPGRTGPVTARVVMPKAPEPITRPVADDLGAARPGVAGIQSDDRQPKL